MSDRPVAYIDEDLEELIPEYIENRLQDIEQINKLLDSGEISQIQLIAHSMKGSGGGYGFDEITVIGGKLEKAAKSYDVNEIRNLNSKLIAYLSSVMIVFQ